MSQIAQLPTLEIQERVVAYIRAGGYPVVAALAAGVQGRHFSAWMRSKHPQCLEFAEAVRAAHAQARLAAEMAAFRERPLDWLKSGPGKETRADAGWSSPARANTHRNDDDFNPLQHPEVRAMLTALLQVLQNHPAARAQVAERLMLAGKEEQTSDGV